MTKFQYISCYGLSNDSQFVYIAQLKFQYISCYGLSDIFFAPKVPHSAFQYISCYGLSTARRETDLMKNYFNTSHVTVYQSRALNIIWHSSNFNTSHVTVYPRNGITLDQIRRISIHLMLRFI